MRSIVVLLVLLALIATSLTIVEAKKGGGSKKAPTGPTAEHSSPLPANGISSLGVERLPVANPVHRNKPKKNGAAIEEYADGVDFLGTATGVPINPTAHLQRSLQEDKKYVASILRTPIDLGDPTDCKHSDVVKAEQELRKIALRINHRRISLAQQQHWIDRATTGLRKIEGEVASTTATARNLAEQLDSLTAQKDDITNHVRRAIQLKELDAQSSTLMRLKNSRLKEEVRLQQKHNEFAIKNHEHNNVLARLHEMRTKQGLALGQLHDPKPYRFAQEGLEAEVEAETDASHAAHLETSSDADAEGETEADVDSETEIAADTETDSEATTEADVAADQAAEGEVESEVETEAQSEAENYSESEGEAEAASEEGTEQWTESETEGEAAAETEGEAQAETEQPQE